MKLMLSNPSSVHMAYGCRELPATGIGDQGRLQFEFNEADSYACP